jgi:hypothetical protein
MKTGGGILVKIWTVAINIDGKRASGNAQAVFYGGAIFVPAPDAVFTTEAVATNSSHVFSVESVLAYDRVKDLAILKACPTPYPQGSSAVCASARNGMQMTFRQPRRFHPVPVEVRSST